MAWNATILDICTRTLLVFVNAVNVTFLCVLIAGQIWAIHNVITVEKLDTKDMDFIVSYLVFSVLSVFIASLGIAAGILHLHPVLMNTFIVSMIMFFLPNFIIAVLFLVEGDDTGVHRKMLLNYFKISIRQYKNRASAKTFVDYFQKKYECCGSVSATDWQNKNDNAEIPDSCCKVDGCNVINADEINVNGCAVEYYAYVKFFMQGLGGFGLIAVLAELPCIACAVGIAIKDRQNSQMYDLPLILQPLKDQKLPKDIQATKLKFQTSYFSELST